MIVIFLFFRNILKRFENTILESLIKEVLRMPGKAKQHVDQSMSTVQTTVNSLQQALNSVEKPENKTKIQDAINSLNTAHQQLSGYQD